MHENENPRFIRIPELRIPELEVDQCNSIHNSWKKMRPKKMRQIIPFSSPIIYSAFFVSFSTKKGGKNIQFQKIRPVPTTSISVKTCLSWLISTNFYCNLS